MRSTLISLLVGLCAAVVGAAVAFVAGMALSSQGDGWEVFDGLEAAVVLGPLAGIGAFVVTLFLRVARQQEGPPEEPRIPVARASFARRPAPPAGTGRAGPTGPG